MDFMINPTPTVGVVASAKTSENPSAPAVCKPRINCLAVLKRPSTVKVAVADVKVPASVSATILSA